MRRQIVRMRSRPPFVSTRAGACVAVALAALLPAPGAIAPGAALADSTAFVRVNQLGYLPDAPKTAVVCALRPVALRTFLVQDARGRTVRRADGRPRAAVRDGAFGPCVETYRLEFGDVRTPASSAPGGTRSCATRRTGATASSSTTRRSAGASCP